MKYAFFAFTLFASAIMPTVAMAAGNTAEYGGFFISGKVGRSDLNLGSYYDNIDTGYGVDVGYRWTLTPSMALGVEGGYTNLSSIGTHGLPAPPVKVDGWSLGVNGRLNLSPNWYISGRGGFFRADLQFSYHIETSMSPPDAPSYQVVNFDATSNRYYAGAGFGYDFSSNFSIGLNYDYYRADKSALKLRPNLISVSAEYRFK
jgi:opacity protein-like surface antigen